MTAPSEMLERAAMAVVERFKEVQCYNDEDIQLLTEVSIDIAHAVLEVIREPTEDVLQQARKPTGYFPLQESMKLSWQAMIDQILAENKLPESRE